MRKRFVSWLIGEDSSSRYGFIAGKIRSWSDHILYGHILWCLCRHSNTVRRSHALQILRRTAQFLPSQDTVEMARKVPMQSVPDERANQAKDIPAQRGDNDTLRGCFPCKCSRTSVGAWPKTRLNMRIELGERLKADIIGHFADPSVRIQKLRSCVLQPDTRDVVSKFQPGRFSKHFTKMEHSRAGSRGYCR